MYRKYHTSYSQVDSRKSASRYLNNVVFFPSYVVFLYKLRDRNFIFFSVGSDVRTAEFLWKF